MPSYQHEFIEYALACEVLKFGRFELKSGRVSPYFFNTGLFNTGAQLQKLGTFYAQALIESKIDVDIFYGPAYKGIPLAVASAMAFTDLTEKDMPFAFNRKEVKDHGEGGVLVGSSLEGKKVLIIDDVITAGTSVRESVEIIHTAKATPIAVLIALDRQEKGQGEMTAIQEVNINLNLPVISIINVTHIIDYLKIKGESEQFSTIEAYQAQWCVKF